MITIIQGILERGLIFSFIVTGVSLTSRIIKRDDLTVEGSFGIGGALTAALLTHGFNPIIATIAAFAIGGLCGLLTGILHTKLKINHLISGIIVTTALFSCNLKLCSSNVALGNATTLFTLIPPCLASIKGLLVLLPLTCGHIFLINRFLKSEIGFLLYTVGENPQMLINLGKKPAHYLTYTFMLSNMLAAGAGSLFVQYIGYFSIWSNVGILIMSLAGLILAELLSTHINLSLLAGAVFYQAIIAATFELQLNQDWNKFVTAGLIVLLIIITQQFNQTKEPVCSR